MGEQTLISVVLVMVGVAFVVGLSVQEQQKRWTAAGFMAFVFFIYSWKNAPDFRAALTWTVYLFVLLFFVPFSFGASIGRRFGKSGPPSAGQ